MEQRITIELTQEDADMFVRFQKFHSVFEHLEREGANTMKNGSITLHFDKNGRVQTVTMNRNFHL